MPIKPDNKLSAIKKQLRAKISPSGSSEKRVQKNLSLSERDAERLKALAKRDGLSQAALFSAALDAYEGLA